MVCNLAPHIARAAVDLPVPVPISKIFVAPLDTSNKNLKS